MIKFHHPQFSDKRILDALTASSRTVDFKYELLDNRNRFKKNLDNIISCSIENSTLAQIKRTARIDMYEDDDIDYLTDRIKPYMRLWIPKERKPSPRNVFLGHAQPSQENIKNESGWIDFPLGVFQLVSPTRKETESGIIREIDAYDGLVILRDNLLPYRLAIEEGETGPGTVESELEELGIEHINIPLTSRELTRTIEFEPGLNRLTIYNDLLRQANYSTLSVDLNGYFNAFPYVNPSRQEPLYSYKTDGKSVIFQGAEEELDMFNVANQFVVVKTNEDEPPLTAIYTNVNPESPTSTVRRGLVKTDYREIDDISSQNALEDYVERIAFEASQVYGRIRFETELMPFHNDSDIIEFIHDPLGISGRFLELSWSMELSVEGKMTHELRQIVDVGGGQFD